MASDGLRRTLRLLQSEPGSEFHVYLLVLKGTALLAADRRSDAAQLTAELYTVAPLTRLKLGLFFLSPKVRTVPPALKPILAAVTIEAGRRLLTHLYRVSARQFERRHHQKNVLHGLAVHLRNIHGPDVIPASLAHLFPKLAASPRVPL